MHGEELETFARLAEKNEELRKLCEEVSTIISKQMSTEGFEKALNRWNKKYWNAKQEQMSTTQG